MSAILSSRENQSVPHLTFENQPPAIQSVNQNTTLTQNNLSKSNANPFHSFLYGATVRGGHFEFHIHNHAPQ